MMDNYWDERTKKNGHTGWADSSIYYFDQQVRINLIEYLFEQEILNQDSLLDYGCGTGDFCRIGEKYFKSIIGVDISEAVLEIARSKKQEARSNYFNVNEFAFDKQYDCILSITVLQHILEEESLIRLLKNFSKCLNKENGRIILLETLGEQEVVSSYSIQRTKETFYHLFDLAGLEVLKEYDFYNPVKCEFGKAFNYKKNIFIRVLNRLANREVCFAKNILERFAKMFVGSYTGISNIDTGTKIIILKSKGVQMK